MDINYGALAIVAGYILLLGVISSLASSSVNSAGSFTSGHGKGHGTPSILIGLILMSEFIGTSTSVGTTQEAYKHGISAAWNVIALGLGFIVYAFLLARKYKESGENTISGIFAKAYGKRARLATSLVMVFALQIIAVATYAGGGAILSGLLGVNQTRATIVCGIIAVLYVCFGGMRSVIHTNIIHALMKYVSIGVALYFGLSQVGGHAGLHLRLEPHMFSWSHVGWAQIFAWFIAGMGATFSTQYVIQAISTVGNPVKAQVASFYSALFVIPFGIAVTIVGMTAKGLFPDIPSISAFSALIGQMDSLTAGIVAAGLAASLFGTSAAISIATATLLYKDVYRPFVSKAPAGAESAKDLTVVRCTTIVMGLLPIVFAIATPDILKIVFLGKALRTSLSVLVLFVFYAPGFGTRTGAPLSIFVSLIAVIGWFLAGNPFGIDNAYLAIGIPLVIMAMSEIYRRFTGKPAARPLAPNMGQE